MQACAQRMSLRQAGGLCGLHSEPRCTARRAWFTVLTRPCPPRAALPPPCSPSSVQQLRVQQQSRVVVPGRRRCVAVSASAAVVSAAARRAAARRPAAAAPDILARSAADSAACLPCGAPQSSGKFPLPMQATKTLKIGTRGSPLALAQAYLTRDLLKASGAPLLSCSTSVRAGRRRQEVSMPCQHCQAALNGGAGMLTATATTSGERQRATCCVCHP